MEHTLRTAALSSHAACLVTRRFCNSCERKDGDVEPGQGESFPGVLHAVRDGRGRDTVGCVKIHLSTETAQ